MRNFILIAGHQTLHPGYVTKFGVECQDTKNLTLQLIDDLYKKGLPIYNPYKSKFTFKNIKAWLYLKFIKPTTEIEFHFNLGKKGECGVEIGINKEYTKEELELAKKLSKVISITLDIKLRNCVLGPGVTINNDFIKKTKNKLLIEVCFISNEVDMFKYRDKFIHLVDKISNYLIKISKES